MLRSTVPHLLIFFFRIDRTVIFGAVTAVVHVVSYLLKLLSLQFGVLIVRCIFAPSAGTVQGIARHPIEKAFAISHRTTVSWACALY
jgi:spore maturation protein SpmB